MRLLILEDDARLSGAFSRRLRTEGFAVDEVRTLREAREALMDIEYDCLVLDRLVPDGDALELMADLHDSRNAPPVLMISGTLDASPYRVEGLEAGADDYIPKPVRLDELAIRVQRLTARAASAGTASPCIDLGRVDLDRARREVLLDGEPVHLTPTQYAVFDYLVLHRDRLVPVEELLAHCWDRHRDLFANPVHSQITRLRKIFAGALGFESVRGVGYLIRVEPDSRAH